MKIIVSFLFLIMCCCSFAQTADYAHQHPELAYVYQQNRFQKEDIVGDVLLAHSLKSASLGLFYIMAGKREQYYSAPYIEAFRLAKIWPSISRINGEDTVYVQELPTPGNYYLLEEKQLAQEIEELFKSHPKIIKGSFPMWSKRFNENYRNKIIPGVPFSKLLGCLIRGACARFMYTGYEPLIEKKVMELPDLSVGPISLLQICLQTSRYDMSMALLACQNTLSWHSKANDRFKSQLQTKLRPFILKTGELSRDKFGEWYHLFGLMTYSFAKGSKRAWIIGQVENGGASVLTGDEPVEEAVNSMAPAIGEEIRNYF